MCDIPKSPPDFAGSGPVEYRPAEDTTIEQEAQLMSIPGVVSVGVGFGPAGGEALIVGVVDAGVGAKLPTELDGIPVITTVIGEVDAYTRR